LQLHLNCHTPRGNSRPKANEFKRYLHQPCVEKMAFECLK
jgi:hypothetical protein